MRMPWAPSKSDRSPNAGSDQADFFNAKPVATGEPLLASIELLEEDPGNPRTEFPDGELAELAADIGVRGILQPIVVHSATADGRYRLLFGAKRLRAAKLAGLREVPVVISASAHDAYAQVAENQKRHGLSPLDLARFMRSRADTGESNAEIARRMNIDQTTVAHHLALLTLPPDLDEALRSGRCTSPRTLYELARLHDERPDQVKAIVDRTGEITRSDVAALKATRRSGGAVGRKPPASRGKAPLAAQAADLCARLESLMVRLTKPGAPVTAEELGALRRRLADLASK
jgi:ParB family transcriptional regulator, chromosome partitioning protein